jgi:Pyridoxamine 5''-phosphate oxidase.
MASWDEVRDEAPELVTAARERFDAHRHKLLATVRRDGAPRISGVEATFSGGELWLAMMPGSRKGDDLRGDPRVALHSSSPDPDDADPSAWTGDAKLAGRATAVDDSDSMARFAGEQTQMPAGPFELFRIDVTELTVIRIGDPADHLVIDTWAQGRGIRRVERR